MEKVNFIKAGAQLASATCTTRVVVVRAPADRQPLIECGGRPMTPATRAPGMPAPGTPAPGTPAPGTPSAKPAPAGPDAATLLGKRYVDEADTVELLCTSAGTGTLSCDGAPMKVKAAKPLPASD